LKFHYFETVKSLPLSKRYIGYAIAYGLSTLIIPFGIQFLVNRLALSGILVNMLIFFVVLFFGLVFTQIIRHSQVILTEALLRSIFANQALRWSHFTNYKDSYYFFEVHNLLKGFSKSFTHMVELSLIVIFGLFSILMFHPFFLLPSAIIILTIHQLVRISGPAIKTSIQESNEKYEIYHAITKAKDLKADDFLKYLNARDAHFNFVIRNSFYVSLTVIGVQLMVLGIGCYLIQINQLSVGQLVSAEIIISGILLSLTKLPLSLEAIYDFETSHYKLDKALKGAE
jgi:putative ABC transport system ATP-binding protein